MKEKINIPDLKLSQLFRKGIFWDVDIDLLDVKRDAYFIIPRILNRFMFHEVFLENLESIYPRDLICYYALNSGEIRGNEKIEFLAKRYGLRPQEFMNYIPPEMM
ncbi:hypothetical protein KIH41_09790 [Litoribacter ruber]|uniref:DUF6922 domain-containing protein n=1 Tax=Litoribacter ruber TaxID=702568 RepID=UPI001BDB62ED|nr:hypothetical protein [Litoribacter ruber]MBT0811567.1 hypothetical protein [Litoribacter ruber]